MSLDVTFSAPSLTNSSSGFLIIEPYSFPLRRKKLSSKTKLFGSCGLKYSRWDGLGMRRASRAHCLICSANHERCQGSHWFFYFTLRNFNLRVGISPTPLQSTRVICGCAPYDLVHAGEHAAALCAGSKSPIQTDDFVH